MLLSHIWAVSPTRRKLGDLLTLSDICHIHTERDAAEDCGAQLRGSPDLLKMAQIKPHVFEVTWSLSTAADGRLRLQK